MPLCGDLNCWKVPLPVNKFTRTCFGTCSHKKARVHFERESEAVGKHFVKWFVLVFLIYFHLEFYLCWMFGESIDFVLSHKINNSVDFHFIWSKFWWVLHHKMIKYIVTLFIFHCKCYFVVSRKGIFYFIQWDINIWYW